MRPGFLRDVPLVKKLRLIVLIIGGTALAGAFAVFMVYQWFSSRSAESNRLWVMATIVGDQSTAALEFGQRAQATTILSSLKAEPEVVAAAVYDKDGRLFASYLRDGGTLRAISKTPGDDGRSFKEGELLVFHPILSAGERIGTLHLASDLSSVWNRLWLNLGVAGLVLAGAVLSVFLLSARLGRAVTAPVLHLVGVVQAVSSKRDYSIRALPQGADELGQLINGFNDMLVQIKTRDEALAQARTDLEHRVLERTRELHEKDVLLSEAQQLARLGSWEWDLAGGRVTWSDETYRIHGLLPVDFAGNLDAFLKSAHPEDRSVFREKLDQARQKREPFLLDHRIIRPDGETRHLQGHGKTVLDDTGQPVRLVGTLQDVTERKRAELAIQDLNRKLQESLEEMAALNKELEGFSYSVSHDLRAPLRAIDGYSRMILEDYADRLDAKGARYFDVIRSNTQKMGQLIDDLLAFSRLGRKHVEVGEISMGAMVRSVYSELEAINPGRHIDFRVGDLPACQGDSAMMRQVLTNFISNAIKYSRNRDPAVIEVGGRPEGGEIVYFVKDNGVGFEMQYVNKLFGVFQRLHSATEFEGTGVGLALAQRILQRHGGRAWAEGKVNEGAVFYFALPRKEAARDGSKSSGNPVGRGQSA